MVATHNSRTYAGQGYDVTYFARKHRISKPQARELMRKYGRDRDKLNEAAIALASTSPKAPGDTP